MRSVRLLGASLILAVTTLVACEGGATVGAGPGPITTATPVVTTSSSPTPFGATPSPTPKATATASPTPIGATPSPTPTTTATATATATMSAAPTTSPSPSVSPTATSVPVAGEKIYVVNHGQLGDNPSVSIFPVAASGQATPLAQIKGANTLIEQPFFDVVDKLGTLYVSNQSNNPISPTAGYITEYDAGNQSGNATPSRTITGLPNPQGLAIDSAGNLIVAMVDKVEVFGPGASGNATPIKVIAGPLTTLQNLLVGGQPEGLALDAAGDIYVSMGPAILEFGPTAVGNVAPINVYGGVGGMNPATTGPPYGSATLASAMGVAVDASNNLYAANFNNSSFAIFTTPTAPGVTVQSTSASQPFGIFVDSAGAIYVASYGNSTVLIYSSMATLIAGVSTTLTSTSINYPYGVTTH